VFQAILGQDPAIQTLQRALTRGKLHHAYRFEGPPGVGKERTALALGQALVCTQTPHTGSNPEAGCGQCSACRRAVHFSNDDPRVPQHPDIVLVAKGLYPPPLVTARETTGISVEQIRKVVLPRVGYGPHEGRGLLVLIRDAEDLTVAAANALLKTLEEPHSGVYFVLLTSAPNRLLDTILSRTQAVRFGLLSEANIRHILREQGKDEAAAAFANGSAQAALEYADPTRLAKTEELIRRVQAASAADTIEAGLELAGELPKDREQVSALLAAYCQALALEARGVVGTRPDLAAEFARNYACAGRAIAALERNVTPLVVVEAMLVELRQSRGLGR
jgi:DNA polymerase III subunit delta'